VNRNANYLRECFLILRLFRPAAPRLESTATQHDDKPGASDDEEQDINPVTAAPGIVKAPSKVSNLGVR
jgi:hypothetical protein